MRLKNIFWITGCIALLGLATACNKVNGYLDKAESGGITDEELFRDYVQTDAFLANIYATGIAAGDWMPVYSFTYAAACDEAKCPYTFNYGTINFTSGLISPTNNSIDIWAKSYQNIRKTNIFLKHIDNLPVNDAKQEAGKSRMKGEVFSCGHFL